MGLISAIQKWLTPPVDPMIEINRQREIFINQLQELQGVITSWERSFISGMTERDRCLARGDNEQAAALTPALHSIHERIQQMREIRRRYTDSLYEMDSRLESVALQRRINAIEAQAVRTDTVREMLDQWEEMRVLAVRKPKKVDVAISVAADFLEERGFKEGADYIRQKVKEEEGE